MYRVPLDLDLSGIVGNLATQLRVGQFDLQFTIGPVDFSIQSPVNLVKDGEVIGTWQESRWPDASFLELMNACVVRWEIPNDRTILIYLENGIEIHLSDDSDTYECIQISVEGAPTLVVI
jgi:hypothetical protein